MTDPGQKDRAAAQEAVNQFFPITIHLPHGAKAVVTETDTTITPPVVDDPRHSLERAVDRGQSLIEVGADAGEPEDTQLSDVLADLMHWADHNHVDFDAAVQSAHRAREAELAEWNVVQIGITNTYEDGHESEYEVWVPCWKGGAPDTDWWEDVVFPHTGDGTGENMSASYEAVIVAVSDPNDTTMCGVSYDWEG